MEKNESTNSIVDGATTAVGEAGSQLTESLTEVTSQSTDALRNSFELAFGMIIGSAPKFIFVLVVLVVGYIIARLASRAMSAVCGKLGLQVAAEREDW